MYLKVEFIKQSLKKPYHTVHAFISVCMLSVLSSASLHPGSVTPLKSVVCAFTPTQRVCGWDRTFPLPTRPRHLSHWCRALLCPYYSSFWLQSGSSCPPGTLRTGRYRPELSPELSIFIKNYSHRLIVIIILFNPAIVSLRPVKLRRGKL